MIPKREGESLLGTLWHCGVVACESTGESWTELILSCALGQDIPLPSGYHARQLYRDHCRYFQALLTYNTGKQEIRWIECYYFEMDFEDARQRIA